MRVAVVAEAASGGVARQLAQLAVGLADRGRDELFFLLGRRPDEPSGDALRRIAASHPVEYLPDFRRSLRRPDRDARALRSLTRALARLAPDGIHTHSAKAGVLGRLAATRLGIPVIHTPHIFPFEPSGSISSLVYATIERRMAHRCRAVVCLNEYQRNDALVRRIAPSEKLFLLPNAVDDRHFRPATSAERHAARAAFGVPDGRRVLGFMGRFKPQKGLDVFWQALASLTADCRDFTVLVAGGAPSPPESGDPVWRAVGEVDDSRIFLHALDGFVLPSRWEGSPYALLEAMACGVPVVATATRGAYALLRPAPDTTATQPSWDQEMEKIPAGWLTRPGDASALAQALSAWRAAPDDELADMGRQARATAGAHPLNPWLAAMRRLYADTFG